VAKEYLDNFGKYLSVDNISYPDLVSELQQWHTMVIQEYLHDKLFQKILKQAKSFGQEYTLRNEILYFTMDN